MMRRLSLVLGLAAAALGGCVNLAPPYEPPQVPVPGRFPSAHAVPATAAPSATGWRQFFVDERLRGTVALALANNRDLRIAALNIDRARALYGIARAAAYPGVDAGLSASRSRSAATGNTASQYTADLGLVSYELDFFGRVRNLRDAALQDFFAQEETRRSAQISLVAEVATAWITLAGDLQRLQLARDTLASQQRSYDLVSRARALGAQSGIALAQARSTVEAARGEVAGFDGLVEQDLNALTLLVGAAVPAELLPPGTASVGMPAPAAAAPPTATAPPATGTGTGTGTGTSALRTDTVPPTPMLPAVSLLLAPPADLPSDILRRRPDVLAAEHALIASHADIGAARAAFYPRIALTGSAGVASSSLSGLFNNGSAVWSFMPSISLPIFDGGANRANLGVAQAQQRIQLSGYEKTLQTAFREVADALAVRRTLGERLSAQQDLVAASARNLELAQALFRQGGSGYFEVLDAQRSLYSAQRALVELQLTEQANRLTLYKVLGGGWTE